VKQRWYWAVLAGAALASGAGLDALGMPAAWFLGPLFAACVVACLRPNALALPDHLFTVALAIIGSVAGTSLTPDALSIFAAYWFAIPLILIALLVLSLLSGLFLAHFGKLDPTTALLGMLPGGAPGMVALSEALHADVRLVTVMQTVRVMLVLGLLTLVTWLFVPAGGAPVAAPPASPLEQTILWQLATVLITVLGAWGGIRLHLPAGAMLGPALLWGVLGLLGLPHTTWPPLVLPLAYALVGLSVGLQFDIPALRMVGKLLPMFVASMLLLIASAAAMGSLLAYFTGADMLSAYLATTPGGLNMVTIVALESSADVLLVLSINLLRFLMTLLFGPGLVRWLAARMQRDEPPEQQAPLQEELP